MKIYINHFNIDVLSSVMENIKEQYNGDSETYIQIYAIDGVYQITNNCIQKMNAVDVDIKVHNNYYENFTLIVDPSYYTIEEVNKIPLEHISRKIKRCFFQINKNSGIRLVIEGPTTTFSNTNNTNNTNNDYGIIPKDIYFEITENIDINDALIKKDIIVFLSLLN